jgi:hypothetical protein
MIKHLAIIAVAAAGISSAVPAKAQDIGVGVGPGGVTVGAVGRDRYRDRDYDRDYYRDRRDRNETVIIKRGRDRGDRYYDGDRRVIERY